MRLLPIGRASLDTALKTPKVFDEFSESLLNENLLVKSGPCVAVAMLVGLAGCGGGSTLSSSGTPRLKVACVGDSITDGNGTFTPYPNTLGDWLGDQYSVGKLGTGGATLLNSGQKPYQQTKSFSKAVQFTPDIVVIDLGTNDRGTHLLPVSERF